MYQPDPYFVDTMRREVGLSNLDMVWRQHERRYSDGGYGCWVVRQHVRKCMPQRNPHGRYMVKSEVVPYDIFILNGNHDLPTRPGRWTIEALVHSDMARRGRARVREVGDWREAKVAREQKARDTLARDRARDPLLLAAMGRQADAYGMAAPTREEMVAMEKHAVRGMEYMSERDAKERRKARLGA